MEFAGEFETHITVALERPGQAELLRDWATAQELKFLHIVLDQGTHCSQPMVTRRSRGDLSKTLAAAQTLCRRLALDGFRATRVKLEAAPWNADIPQAPDVATSSNRYFEHHLKLRTHRSDPLTKLAEQLQSHGAQLSRNALRTTVANAEAGDGIALGARCATGHWQERFVTQRCWGVGQNSAGQQLEKLRVAIAQLGYPILEIEEEYVVYDSNLALDAGWLAAKE